MQERLLLLLQGLVAKLQARLKSKVKVALEALPPGGMAWVWGCPTWI